ncbi:hypothetical protein J4402_05630 [Candidatus Pacearchaeota archaeon]|nr:hypothetical protein [Candidatus Pacearchaeota archaeon]
MTEENNSIRDESDFVGDYHLLNECLKDIRENIEQRQGGLVYGEAEPLYYNPQTKFYLFSTDARSEHNPSEEYDIFIVGSAFPRIWKEISIRRPESDNFGGVVETENQIGIEMGWKNPGEEGLEKIVFDKKLFAHKTVKKED